MNHRPFTVFFDVPPDLAIEANVRIERRILSGLYVHFYVRANKRIHFEPPNVIELNQGVFTLYNVGFPLVDIIAIYRYERFMLDDL